MYIVLFTRKFESGLLKGKEIADNIKFSSWYSANDWINAVTGKLIENEYRITNAWIEAYTGK